MSVTVNTMIFAMARWEPDARGRLERAAMELYAERGFEDTTVAEIAARAGVTERTFFRHFADKREVLFAGSDAFAQLLLTPITEAPPSLSPLQAAAAGLRSAAEMLQQRREFSRRRHAIIAASPELRERELIKLASLAAAMAEALRERGVPEATATLVAEVAMAVFRATFARWVTGAERGALPQLLTESLTALEQLSDPQVPLAHAG